MDLGLSLVGVGDRNMKPPLQVGQRFKIVADSFDCGPALGRTGTVTEVTESGFSIKLDDNTGLEQDWLAFFEDNWSMQFWLKDRIIGDPNPIGWGDYPSSQDWYTAANRHRDEIFRHMFRVETQKGPPEIAPDELESHF